MLSAILQRASGRQRRALIRAGSAEAIRRRAGDGRAGDSAAMGGLCKSAQLSGKCAQDDVCSRGQVWCNHSARSTSGVRQPSELGRPHQASADALIALVRGKCRRK